MALISTGLGDIRRRKATRQVSQKKLQTTLALQAEGLKSVPERGKDRCKGSSGGDRGE